MLKKIQSNVEEEKSAKQQKYIHTAAINIAAKEKIHTIQKKRPQNIQTKRTHRHTDIQYAAVLKSLSFVLLCDYYYYKSVYMAPE